MNIIFRPYVNVYKTARCLSEEHVSLMKLNSSIAINIIYQKMGLVEKNELYDRYKNDSFIVLYYNKGKPYINILLEYYCAVYFYWLKKCGDKIDFIGNAENIYRDNEKKFDNGDPWEDLHTAPHKLYLIRYDEFWYKRYFKKYYRCRIKDYNLFKSRKPRIIKKKELIKLEE